MRSRSAQARRAALRRRGRPYYLLRNPNPNPNPNPRAARRARRSPPKQESLLRIRNPRAGGSRGRCPLRCRGRRRRSSGPTCSRPSRISFSAFFHSTTRKCLRRTASSDVPREVSSRSYVRAGAGARDARGGERLGQRSRTEVLAPGVELPPRFQASRSTGPCGGRRAKARLDLRFLGRMALHLRALDGAEVRLQIGDLSLRGSRPRRSRTTGTA